MQSHSTPANTPCRKCGRIGLYGRTTVCPRCYYRQRMERDRRYKGVRGYTRLRNLPPAEFVQRVMSFVTARDY